jgi:regulation of enolase protein 1 (concanavalin A-like superfamily)
LYGAGASGGTEYDWSEWQVQLSTGTGFTKKAIPKKKNNLKDDYVGSADFLEKYTQYTDYQHLFVYISKVHNWYKCTVLYKLGSKPMQI